MVLAEVAVQAAMAVEAKATTTANKMVLVALVALAVHPVEQTLAMAGAAELAGLAETAALTETAVATVRQGLLEILAATEITPMVVGVLAALEALAAAQPVSTSVACPMSHLRTMALSKEGQRNGIHYS